MKKKISGFFDPITGLGFLLIFSGFASLVHQNKTIDGIAANTQPEHYANITLIDQKPLELPSMDKALSLIK